MLAIFLFIIAGGVWSVHRIAREVMHGVPRGNDDMIFF